MRVRGNEEIEKDGVDARTLRDARSGEAFGGGSVFVAAAGNAPPEVRVEPPQCVVVEVGGAEGGD